METKNDEENNKIPGQEFLLKKDDKHLGLLKQLNDKIKLYDDPEGVDVDVVKLKKDLIKFINDHYKTFIARLQAGLPIEMLKLLLMDFPSSFHGVLHDPLKFIDEAKNRGLIFAICYNKEGTEMMYIIDPKKECDQKKEFEPKKECESTIERIKKSIKDVEKIKVIAPGKNMVEEALEEMLNFGSSEKGLTLLPINEVCFSCISFRQTKAVENCCKVINSFTEKKVGDEKLKVELDGTSQGVDFITKMVGSTHGNDSTRLKNANIELNITAPHIFQDEEKIVKRLINGATKNNNTIKNINITNNIGECIHPTCRTDNLIELLQRYQQYFNNKVELKYYQRHPNGKMVMIGLRTLGSNQQNTLN